MITDLPPATGQPADRRLIGHAAREAQHVGHRVLFAGIRIHAAATKGRAERGIVDRYQRPQAAGSILREQQRLMTVVIGVTEHLSWKVLRLLTCSSKQDQGTRPLLFSWPANSQA